MIGTGKTIKGGERRPADTVRVLVANEPRAYREVLAAVLGELRRHLDVHMVAPHEVEEAVTRLAPQLVLCSHLTPAVESQPLSWIVLYPNGDDRAVISLAGYRSSIDEVGLSHLLGIVDQTEYLHQRR